MTKIIITLSQNSAFAIKYVYICIPPTKKITALYLRNQNLSVDLLGTKTAPRGFVCSFALKRDDLSSVIKRFEHQKCTCLKMISIPDISNISMVKVNLIWVRHVLILKR